MLGEALREARLKKQGGGANVPSPLSKALPLNNSIPIKANKPIIQPPIPPANVTTPIKASISAAPAIKEPSKPDVLEWKPNPKYAKQFRYQKYINFKNMNVGDHVVKARMKVDGISDIDIESFFDCSEMTVVVGTPVTAPSSATVSATTSKSPTSLPMKADFSHNNTSSEWKPNNEYANKPQYIKYTNLKNQNVAEHMIRAIMKIDGILSKDQDGFFRKESVTTTTTGPATAIAGKTSPAAPLSIADQIKAAKAAKLNVNVAVPPSLSSSPSDQSTASVTLSPSSGSSSITSGNINHFCPPTSPTNPHNSISSNSSSGSSSNNSPNQQPHHHSHHHSHQNKSNITNLIEVNSPTLKPPLLPASQEPLRPGYTADGNYDHDQQSLRVKVSMLFLDPTAAISTNNTTATSAETSMSVFEQRYGKYIKMHKMNAVEGSIRQRMEIDGITQKSEQDAFFRLLTDHLKEEKKKLLLTSLATDEEGEEEDEVISTHQQLQELKEEALLQQQQQYQFMLLQQHHQLHSDSIDSMNNDDNISIADSVQTFNRPIGTAASSDDYSSLRKKRVNAPAAFLLKPTPLDTAAAVSVTTNNQPTSPSPSTAATAATTATGVVGIERCNQTEHHNNVSNNNLTAHLPSTTTPTATTVSVPTVKNILLPQDSFLTKSTLVRTRNPTPNRNSSSSTASNTTSNTISTHPKITSDMVITKSTITKARSYNDHNNGSSTNNNDDKNNNNTNLRRNYSARPNILVNNTVNNPKVTHDMMITKSTITKAKVPNPKLTPDMVLTKSTVTRAHHNYNPYASGSSGNVNNKNNSSININTSTAAIISASGLTTSKLKSATLYGYAKNYIPFSDFNNNSIFNDDMNIAPVVRSANNSEISFVAMMKRRSIQKSTGSVASVAATCGSHDENRINGITNSTMTKTTPAAAAVSNVNSIKQPQPQQPLSPTQQLRYTSPFSFSERSDRNTAGALTEMAYQDYDVEEEGELEYHNFELNGENEFDREQYTMMDDYSFYGDEEVDGVVKYDESHLPTTSSSSPIVVNSNGKNSINNINNNATATTTAAHSQPHSAQSPVYRPAAVPLAGTDSSDVSSEADSASQYTDTDKIRPLGYVTTPTNNTTGGGERVGSNKSLPKARPVSAKFKPKHEHSHHKHGNLSEKSRGCNTSINSTKSVGTNVGAIVNAAINTAISGKWSTSGSNNSSSHGDNNNNNNDDGSDYDEGSVQSHHTTVPKTKNATFFAGMIEAQRLEQKEREEMESKLDKCQLAELRRREEAERQHDSERRHHYSVLGAVFTKNKSPLSTPSTPRGSPFFPASPRTTAEPDTKANTVFQSPLLITQKKPLIIVPPIATTTTTSTNTNTPTSLSPTSITGVNSPHSPHPPAATSPATHQLSPVSPSTTTTARSHLTSPRVPIDPRTMNAYTGEALLRALEDLSMRVKATADTVTATASSAVTAVRESLSRTNSFSNQLNTSSHGNNNNNNNTGNTSLSSPSSKLLSEREQLSSSIESASSVLSAESLRDEQQQQGSTSARRVSARRGSAVNMIKLDSQ